MSNDKVTYEFCVGWGEPTYIFYVILITLICVCTLQLCIYGCVLCIGRSYKRKYTRISSNNLEKDEQSNTQLTQ